MGGGIILIITALMVLLTILVRASTDVFGIQLHHTLWNRQETFLPLFALFSLGILGAIDDYMNVRLVGGKKGMSSRMKLIGLIGFAFLGAYWFSVKLGHDSITIPGL
jgi:UDP-N-acetylmuramyl pentapeptide phosphotransferase/UDP-N-acetylglucosamine-1-phosphate transferase